MGRLNRYLKEDFIDLDFRPLEEEADPWASGHAEAEGDQEEGDEGELWGRRLFETKVRILDGLVDLLERSGKVGHRRRLFEDLRNREAKATTGLGRGVAMPHVRTNRAKGFAMAVAVAPEPGLPFDAVDDEPVRVFFCMVAPAHDDKYYLKVERNIAAAVEDEDVNLVGRLIEAEDAGEVVRILGAVIDR